jgi:uncharacterized protein YoaH (UPF0181 family)
LKAASSSSSLGHAIEFFAEDPRKHKENNKHGHAKTRESIAQ